MTLDRASPDASSELVELCEPEALGIFDDHHTGIWRMTPKTAGNAKQELIEALKSDV